MGESPEKSESILLQRIEHKLDILLKQKRSKKTVVPRRKGRVNFSISPQREPGVTDTIRTSTPGVQFQEADKSFEDAHQMTIRENFLNLLRNIDLSHSLVLDQLFEDDVLSQSDVEDINRGRRGKDKTRLLLQKLERYDPRCFLKFVDALQTENADLAVSLRREYEQRKGQQPRLWNCVHCKMMQDVDLCDIVDELYQKHILCKNDLSDIIQNRDWSLLKSCVNVSQNTFDIFVCSVYPKYSHLGNELRGEWPSLQCRCDTSSLPRDESSSSSETESVVGRVEWWTDYEQRGLRRQTTFRQRGRVIFSLCRHESLCRKPVRMASTHTEFRDEPIRTSSYSTLTESNMPVSNSLKEKHKLIHRISESCSRLDIFHGSSLLDISEKTDEEDNDEDCMSEPNVCYENDNESFPETTANDISDTIICGQTCDKEMDFETSSSSDEEKMLYDDMKKQRRKLSRSRARRYRDREANEIREKYRKSQMKADE